MMRALLLIGALLVLPGPLRAQAGEGATATGASPTVTFLVRASDVAGAQRIFLGGWAGLWFGERVVLGGGGLALTRQVEIRGSESGSGFDLGMGYGGLYLGYRLPLSSRLRVRPGLLLGAGHAELRDRLIDRELGADNFFVAEPELTVVLPLLSSLNVGASVGYRWAGGLDGLPRVGIDDVRALTWSLSVGLGGPGSFGGSR